MDQPDQLNFQFYLRSFRDLNVTQTRISSLAVNMNGESSKTKLNKKTFIQTKLHFPEATQSIKPIVTNREKGKYVSRSIVPEKRKDLEPNPAYEEVDFPKQKKLKLKDILLDENFEKLDEKHVYCHYCDTGKSITLHRPNDGDRLWTHINTTLHIDNKAAGKNISKKVRTTFLTQYINVDDQDNDSQHDDNNLQCNINSQYKVCNGFFSRNYAALAKYGTKGKDYQILRNDTLLDKNEKAEGYFKHDRCKGKTYSRFCSPCASLASNESFNKRNRRMQTLLAQIDCLFLLKEGQEIPRSFRTQFNHNSDIEWLNMNYQQLYNVITNTIKHRPGSATSDALKNLLDYVTLELKDNSYHSLVESYPALGQILEAVEANGLENWIGKCTAFMINKTMDEQRPVFFGMAQAVTKVLDKMERGVTTMRGIGQYSECFVDFLIILMSISTLSVRWITANLAGPTIRFARKKRNENNEVSNIYGINSCMFEELIAIWRTAYNYYGPTVCAKDQTKVAEMIEVCRTRQQWVGSVPIDTSIIPHLMTAEELHAKISSFEKATYITVFALSAILPGIPPLVLAVIPSNQKETKADAFFENNTILKELVKSGAKPIGLYFDGATHDRSWIGETYSKNSSVYGDLNIISDDTTFFSKKFPIGIGMFDNGRPLISGTDVFHCVKKGRNMHNGGARVCPIGNFIMSTEHLWYLKERYGNKSGLTNELLNPKDKQSDELAERFFSSNVLTAMVQHAIEYNDDSVYGDILYHFFAGLLFESWKSRTMDHLSRVQFAWAATIFFAMTRYYLLSNQNQRNSQKYGISWQSNDDFIYLGTTLILLIHQFPNHYPGTPLCPWIISTAFLEHIFGYARRIIEDFTVLDFLMMNEKLIKTISIEMKGNLIRPDNNDGYNIHLSTASDKLPETLSNFPNVYDIDFNMIKVSKAMNSILQSVGINYELSEYITIIQNTLCTLKHNSFSSVLGNIADDIDNSDIDDDNSDQISEDQISKMLLQHQNRIKKRNNLPAHSEQLISENDDEFISECDSTDNSFFDIVNRDVQCKKEVDRIFIMKKMGETRAVFDEYTQKEHRKSNNKTVNNNNTKNFVVETDNGQIELAAALRYERMHANAKSVRTKGRISRWTTACKKVFETTKMSPQVSKFKAGSYFFFVDKSHSILIAEIIAVFVKRGASYVRTDVSDGENANRIHARLFEQSPDSDRKFIPITAKNREQFTCETYSFRFFAALGDIEATFYGTSKWMGKRLWLSDLQLTSYFYWKNNIANIENSIINAEKIMKQNKNNDDSY